MQKCEYDSCILLLQQLSIDKFNCIVMMCSISFISFHCELTSIVFFVKKMTDQSPPRKLSRIDCDLYLIGREEHQIIDDKLPSNRKVLSVFLHNTRKLRFTYAESAALVIDEVKLFWAKARIPTFREDYCRAELIKLHTEWRNLQRSASRKSNKKIHLHPNWTIYSMWPAKTYSMK